MITYRCGNAFILKAENSRYVFELQAAIMTNVAYKTEELGHKRRLFESVFKLHERNLMLLCSFC